MSKKAALTVSNSLLWWCPQLGSRDTNYLSSNSHRVHYHCRHRPTNHLLLKATRFHLRRPRKSWFPKQRELLHRPQVSRDGRNQPSFKLVWTLFWRNWTMLHRSQHRQGHLFLRSHLVRKEMSHHLQYKKHTRMCITILLKSCPM